MSLMESSELNGDLHIDPKFDIKQRWIRTSDKESASRAWFVNFFNGYCNVFDIVINVYYVRAVR